ncbi:MAG: thioredoxin domain-containing protein [Ilumatobacteraceae bacterium]|nr:thioredoxin domain-containing protein [Acidimicrobiaceae bacterium]MBP6488669.1 thioredoxin domain-containing protein [Ilumatobacteraceae bacterium]MBP8208492.1 thioredoxin domain-containing protein [Ilumatobacteraceae bacterium]
MNRLADEASPYLRQHRDNPVDWYPWDAPALAAAEARNVPILLSVGYSACHWCHVMAHECFEDAEVAEVMNRLFVNVKVDREERPDVDAIYMDAVQAMTGRGGWPMTVFLTPAGEPFYGGTYFPKPQFMQLMASIDDVWRNRPDDIQQNVKALGEALQRSANVLPVADYPGPELVLLGLQQLTEQFDAQWGGFGGAPKFPSTMSLDLVARALRVSPTDELRAMLTTSLDAMASGGIYDHLGGGFARYSVDAQWLVPHFEKMLYDQALLVRVYVHAALLTGEARYRQVVEETVGYVLRDLCHPAGGFFSAEDADSPDEHGHGHEGLFHTWTVQEVRAVLGADADEALSWYEFTADGNFEGRTIPARVHHRGDIVRPAAIERARQRLFEAREQRLRPGLDDKVLTEWNGLMLASLCEAAAAFDRPDWRDAAIANGEFLLRELRQPSGRWHRAWHEGGSPPARHHALAGDHATVVDAFTRLAELTGQARWVEHAREVADVLLDHFWDVDRGGLFTTPDDGEQLVARQKELLDNATPSANSSAALALARLGALTGEARYTNHADQIIRLLARAVPQSPAAFSQALMAVASRQAGATEIVITGDRRDLLAEVRRHWLPDAVMAWGEPFDSPLWHQRADGLAFVCHDHACQLPAENVTDLAAQLL